MTAPFIMLVDDEVPFVEIMAKRLDNRDIRAISAFSGQECLETLKTNQTLDPQVHPSRVGRSRSRGNQDAIYRPWLSCSH